MTEVLFNLLLVALLAVPAVTLVFGPMEKGGFSARPIAAWRSCARAPSRRFWPWDCGRHLSVDLCWLAPFPFMLSIDRLSAYFLLLICVVGAPVVLFSTSYVERHYKGPRRHWLWALLSLFLLSMVVVVTAATAFAFLFGWELMTLFSAALVLIDGDDGERRRNIFIYLLMMHAGAAAVVGAFLVFLPHSTGLDFASLRAGAPLLLPAGARTAIFLLGFVGFGTKAGIVPLHLWLPKAHPIAPSPVSALMSGVMLKTAVYGFVRLVFDLLGAGPAWWGYLVLAAGAVSGLLGVLYAISEHDLKRLLAYHSVENIGIIYLGLGAAMVFAAQHAPAWAMLALMGALLHSLNHALFKSLLFLGAGAIADAAHTLDLEELGGLFQRMRVTGTVFLVACCSIVGLPLFNGFVSEWLTFRSFVAGANLAEVAPAIVLPLMAGVLALIGGLAAACFAKVYGVAFLGRPRSLEARRRVRGPVADANRHGPAGRGLRGHRDRARNRVAAARRHRAATDSWRCAAGSGLDGDSRDPLGCRRWWSGLCWSPGSCRGSPALLLPGRADCPVLTAGCNTRPPRFPSRCAKSSRRSTSPIAQSKSCRSISHAFPRRSPIARCAPPLLSARCIDRRWTESSPQPTGCGVCRRETSRCTCCTCSWR